MALLYPASLHPTKLELLKDWLPGRPWFAGDPEVRQLGGYRFDDPAGEVGIEAFIVQSDDRAVHVPMTYRNAPLPGADDFLIGTSDHAVLGKRWVYDGCADPVLVSAFVSAILAGGPQAEEEYEEDGKLLRRQPSATVTGSGTAGSPVPAIASVSCEDGDETTVVRAGAVELVVVRAVGTEVSAPHTLTGRWDGGSAVLAGVR